MVCRRSTPSSVGLLVLFIVAAGLLPLAHTLPARATSGGPAVLLKDINPATPSSEPNTMTTAGNLAFFLADDGRHGFELWKTDATPTGTALVSDLTPGLYSTHIFEMVGLNTTLFFTVRDESTRLWSLWRSDGTYAGTIDLYSSAFQWRRVVFARNFGTVGSHTLKIVVVGGGSHPIVDVDAFIRLYRAA